MSMSCHDASGDNTLNVDAKVSSGIPQLWKIHAVQFDHWNERSCGKLARSYRGCENGSVESERRNMGSSRLTW